MSMAIARGIVAVQPALRIACYIVTALCAATIVEAQSTVKATADAIRIVLKPARTTTYTVGTKPDLVLSLVSSKGSPFKAPKDLRIAIEAQTLDRKVVHKEEIVVKRGNSSEDFDLDVNNLNITGAIRVRATNPELLEGGTVLYAAPKSDSPSRKKPAPPLAFALFQPMLQAPFDDVVKAVRSVHFGVQALEHKATIIVEPARALLADGQDFAELTLLVPSIEAETDFFLSTTRGSIVPNRIRIRPDDPIGKTRLTSDTVGEATVECAQTVPPTALMGKPSVTVLFRKPVARFELVVTPPRIPWVDRASIKLRLLREDGAAIETDEKKRFSLNRDSALGEIIPEVVEIDVGEFEGSATFHPFDVGTVGILAATPGFLPQRVNIEVISLPYLMLLLPVFGGMCGGLVASVRQTRRSTDDRNGDEDLNHHDTGVARAQPARRSSTPNVKSRRDRGDRSRAIDETPSTTLRGVLVRMLVGVLTGMVLHWVLVFDLVPAIPRQVVMSLASWFFVPVIGGWSGTEVFRLLLKKFGISF